MTGTTVSTVQYEVEYVVAHSDSTAWPEKLPVPHDDWPGSADAMVAERRVMMAVLENILVVVWLRLWVWCGDLWRG
jgi:hypothetical protein